MPPLIILLENPNFMKVSSLFEMKTILTMKIFIILNKKLNFFEILISSLLLNLFEVYFIKKYYIKSDLLGLEIKDKKLRKINQFKINFKFLTKGYILCCIWFTFIFNKLEFYVLDEILEELGFILPSQKKFIYLTFFILFSSKILIQKLFTLNQSQFYFNLIENAQRYIIAAIFFHLILSYFLTGGISCFFLSLLTIVISTYIYSKLGFIIFPMILLFYFEGLLLRLYLDSNFKDKETPHIIANFKYSNISMIISIIFIIIVYYQTEAVRIFHQIYERIFYLKVLFDIFLIITWIYNLRSQFGEIYLNVYFKSYKVVFILFIIHYIFIYFAVFGKLNLKMEDKTVDTFFPEIKSDVMNYSKSTPYYEIKTNKRLRFIFCLFAKPIDNLAKTALKNIQTLSMCIIALGFCIIINDSRIFFLVYLILVQILQKTYFKHYLNNFINFYKFLSKVINNEKLDFRFSKVKDYYLSQDTNKIKNPKSKKSSNKKHKLIYIFVYPYASLIWKIFFSKVILILYEAVFPSIFSGEIEPFSNTIYRTIVNNSYDNSFSFLDYINIIFFLLPNTLFIFYTHFENKSPSLFIQNYAVLNLFGLYINGSIELLVLGVLNIVVIISLMAVDMETYLQFNLWFDVLGISPYI